MTVSNERILGVLDPLCKATEQSLAPIHMFSNDYLEIKLDDEGKKFITQACTYNPKRNDDEEIREIDGEAMVRSNHGASRNASVRWQKRIPERKELGYGKWALAVTDFTALIIHHIWPKEKLLFADEETELLYTFLLKRFLHQTRAMEFAARFKINNEVPELPDDFVEHPELPLSDYQKVALVSCFKQEAFALFMEQGTGKTPVVINRINLEAARKRAGKLFGVKEGMYRALIICPNQVRMNWEREFVRFATNPGKTVVMRGGIIRRQKALIDGIRSENDCTWSAVIIGTDTVPVTWEAIKRVKWDLVVLDESHYIKNHQSKRFKTLKNIDSTRARAKMVLTGTPIANTIFDLWSQLEFLGEGLSGFMSFANFRSFHGKFATTQKAGSSPIQRLIGIKGLPLIQERLARLSFMIRKNEANLQLPDKVYDIEEVEMTAIQAEYYKKIASQLVLEIESMLEDETKNMTVDHILTMLLRLAQITSGHVKWDPKTDFNTGETVPGRVEQIPGINPKVEAIINMISDPDRDPNGKTIVWCTFIEDMRVISEALANAGIKHVGYHKVIHSDYRERDAREAEQKFNLDTDCKVFVGNPASAGEGLNILGYDRENSGASTTYTDHVIYMSCNWSMIQRTQSEDRAHRRGTRSNVRITDLVVPGTIDEEIRARVLAKKQTALLIQDIRNILKRVV